MLEDCNRFELQQQKGKIFYTFWGSSLLLHMSGGGGQPEKVQVGLLGVEKEKCRDASRNLSEIGRTESLFCSYRVLFRVPLRKPNAKWAYSQLGWILGWNLNRWEIV